MTEAPDQPAGQPEPGVALHVAGEWIATVNADGTEQVQVIRLSELAALGFVHADDVEFVRRALRVVARYADRLPRGVRDVLAEIPDGGSYGRPTVTSELVEAALEQSYVRRWPAKVTTARFLAAERALHACADRYRAAHDVEPAQADG